MRNVILIVLTVGFIQCTKQKNDAIRIEKLVNDSILIVKDSIINESDSLLNEIDSLLHEDYRAPLLGEFNFIIYKYYYTTAAEFDTVTPTIYHFDTLYYSGNIDTLGENGLSIKYMNMENDNGGCLVANDTLYNGYGRVTPFVDSINIMMLLMPFTDCYNGLEFEGVFETLDSVVFHIGADGMGGGYHEYVVGVRF